MQLRENTRFLVRFAALIGAAVFLVSALLVGLIDKANLLPSLRYLALATFVALAALLFLQWVSGKSALARKILGVPDFDGRWEGWYYRNLTKIWEPICIEIRQKGLTVNVASYTQHNSAKSIATAIEVDEHLGSPMLIVTYRADVLTRYNDPGAQHIGTMMLRLTERDGVSALEGRYFTDRMKEDGTRGSQGHYELVRVSSKLLNGLNLSQSSWPIPKPKEAPTNDATEGARRRISPT